MFLLSGPVGFSEICYSLKCLLLSVFTARRVGWMAASRGVRSVQWRGRSPTHRWWCSRWLHCKTVLGLILTESCCFPYVFQWKHNLIYTVERKRMHWILSLKYFIIQSVYTLSSNVRVMSVLSNALKLHTRPVFSSVSHTGWSGLRTLCQNLRHLKLAWIIISSREVSLWKPVLALSRL